MFGCCASRAIVEEEERGRASVVEEGVNGWYSGIVVVVQLGD